MSSFCSLVAVRRCPYVSYVARRFSRIFGQLQPALNIVVVPLVFLGPTFQLVESIVPPAQTGVQHCIPLHVFFFCYGAMFRLTGPRRALVLGGKVSRPRTSGSGRAVFVMLLRARHREQLCTYIHAPSRRSSWLYENAFSSFSPPAFFHPPSAGLQRIPPVQRQGGGDGAQGARRSGTQPAGK